MLGDSFISLITEAATNETHSKLKYKKIMEIGPKHMDIFKHNSHCPSPPTFLCFSALKNQLGFLQPALAHDYSFEQIWELSTHSFLLLPKCFLRAILIHTI